MNQLKQFFNAFISRSILTIITIKLSTFDKKQFYISYQLKYIFAINTKILILNTFCIYVNYNRVLSVDQPTVDTVIYCLGTCKTFGTKS